MARPSSGRRERIIKAASRMIWARSYRSISADHICEEVGINKGVFYHYFKNKEALVIAALEHHWEQVEQAAMRILSNKATDPVERLMELIDGVLNNLSNEDGFENFTVLVSRGNAVIFGIAE